MTTEETDNHAEDSYEGEVPQTRRKLPIERKGVTHKFGIYDREMGLLEGYVTANTYEDGTVGEIFVAGVGKEGSLLDGFVQAWAMEFSIALQFGAPLDMQVRKHAHMKFPPGGKVMIEDSANDGKLVYDKEWPIPHAHSVIAYIAEWLALRFGTPELQEQMCNIRESLITQ